MHRIFIGLDERQPVSYNVLSHSIVARTSEPVAVIPLKLDTLPLKRCGLTPFTFSRFLVPYLCEFKGMALFMDLDILVRGDIAELFALADENYAAQVVKNKIKFEWASMIMFNCSHPSNAVLTPEYVEKAEGLHKLSWLDEKEVGDLPAEWNHCVGYDEQRPDAKLIHYTQGVPAFPETMGCEHAEAWLMEGQRMTSTRPWSELMGNSVHAQHVYQRLSQQGAANG